MAWPPEAGKMRENLVNLPLRGGIHLLSRQEPLENLSSKNTLRSPPCLEALATVNTAGARTEPPG